MSMQTIVKDGSPDVPILVCNVKAEALHRDSILDGRVSVGCTRFSTFVLPSILSDLSAIFEHVQLKAESRQVFAGISFQRSTDGLSDMHEVVSDEA